MPRLTPARSAETMRHVRGRRGRMWAGLAAVAVLVAAALGGRAKGASGNVFIANAGVLGSLVNGLKVTLPAAIPGVTVSTQTGGSVALAQSIESGSLAPDIFGRADANVHHLLVQDKETWLAA